MSIANTVKAAKKGNKKAIEDLYNQYIRELYAIAYSFVHNEQEAEDLAHDSFLKALEKLDTLNKNESFHLWLKQIVTRKCLTRIKSKRDFVVEDDEINDIETMANTENGDYTKILPHQNLDKNETSKMIYDIISELPDIHKTVIYMHYYSNMSLENISKELGISLGTVKSRLSHARDKVEKKIRLYEKQGIKLYTNDIFSGLDEIIKNVSQSQKLPSNFSTFWDTSGISHGAVGNLSGTNASATNLVSSHTSSIVSSGVAHSVSNTLATKLSIGSTVAVAAACIFAVTAISNNSNPPDVPKPESSHHIELSYNSNAENNYPSDESHTDSSTLDNTNSGSPNVGTGNPFNSFPSTEPSTVYVDRPVKEISTVEKIKTVTEPSVVVEERTIYIPVENSNTTTVSKDYSKSTIVDVGDFSFRVYPVNNEATLTACNEDLFGSDIEIPDYVDYEGLQIPVTKMSPYIFQEESIESVVLPEHLVEIPAGAFYNSTVSKVTLGQEVEKISNYAFYGCKFLSVINFPDRLQSIGMYAFEDCGNLTELKTGNYLEEIGENAFLDAGISNVSLGNSPVCIMKSAFAGCPITNFNIPETAVHIDNIFNNSINSNSPIENLTISYIDPTVKNSSRIYKGSQSLYPSSQGDGILDCIGIYNNIQINNLTVIVPQGTKVLKSGFFSYDDDNSYSILENTNISVILNDDLERIDDNAFYNNKNITTISIPESVQSIGAYAFADCDNLSDVEILNPNTSIGTFAFQYTKWFKNQTLNELGEQIYSITINNSFYLDNDEETVQIPDNVVSISQLENDNITELTIPAKVSYISTNIYCSNLKKINVDENNPYFSSVDGVLFNKDKTELILYPSAKETELYTVPDSVTKLNPYSFSICYGHLPTIKISKNFHQPNHETSTETYDLENLTYEEWLYLFRNIDDSENNEGLDWAEILRLKSLSIPGRHNYMLWLNEYTNDKNIDSTIYINSDDDVIDESDFDDNDFGSDDIFDDNDEPDLDNNDDWNNDDDYWNDDYWNDDYWNDDYWNDDYWNDDYWDDDYWNDDYWNDDYWDDDYWDDDYWDDDYWDDDYWNDDYWDDDD